MSQLVKALELAKKKTVEKSLSQLKGAFEQVNQKGFDGGLSSFSAFMDKFTNVGMALSPFQLVLNEIKASTTQDSMNLYREVLEMVRSDGMQSAMVVVKEMLHLFISGDLNRTITEFSALINNLNSVFTSLGASDGFLKMVIDSLWILDDNLELLNKIIKNLKDSVESFTSMINKDPTTTSFETKTEEDRFAPYDPTKPRFTL